MVCTMKIDNSITSNSKEKIITLTCPICNTEINFAVHEKELRLGKSMIKKIINHGNQHVIVVHMDSKGKVRRMYGYECTEIEKMEGIKKDNTNSTCTPLTLSDDQEQMLDSDPDNFLETLLRDMERSSGLKNHGSQYQ